MISFSGKSMSAESDLKGITLLSNRLSLRAFTSADAPKIFYRIPTATKEDRICDGQAAGAP
jgi:hypothetical protein